MSSSMISNALTFLAVSTRRSDFTLSSAEPKHPPTRRLFLYKHPEVQIKQSHSVPSWHCTWQQAYKSNQWLYFLIIKNWSQQRSLRFALKIYSFISDIWGCLLIVLHSFTKRREVLLLLSTYPRKHKPQEEKWYLLTWAKSHSAAGCSEIRG